MSDLLKRRRPSQQRTQEEEKEYDAEQALLTAKVVEIHKDAYILPEHLPYAYYVPIKRGAKPGSGGLLDWLRLCKYQYCVTVGFYALTGVESLILHAILLLVLVLSARYLWLTLLFSGHLARKLTVLLYLSLAEHQNYYSYHQQQRRPLNNYERARLAIQALRKLWAA
jgi:hypothetical protein